MEELKRIVCSGNFVILFLLVFLVNGFFYEKKQYSVDEEERIYGEDFDYAEMRKEMMQEYRKLYSDLYRWEKRKERFILKNIREK